MKIKLNYFTIFTKGFLVLVPILAFLVLRCDNLLSVLQDPTTQATSTDQRNTLYMTLAFLGFMGLFIGAMHTSARDDFVPFVRTIVLSFFIAIIGMFYLDFLFILAQAMRAQYFSVRFVHLLMRYIGEFWQIYIILIGGLIFSLMARREFDIKNVYARSYIASYALLIFGIIFAAIFLAIAPVFIAARIFTVSNFENFTPVPIVLWTTLNTLYAVITLWLLWRGFKLQRDNQLSNTWTMVLTALVGLVAVTVFLFNVYFTVSPAVVMAWNHGVSQLSAIGFGFGLVWDKALVYVPLLVLGFIWG